MMYIKKPFTLPHLAFVIALVVLDQYLKYVIRQSLRLGQSIQVTPFLQIIHLENTGIAFGFFYGMNIALIFVMLLIIAVLVFLSREIEAFAGRWSVISMTLILGGACGNLCDRILRGRITDFIYFGAGKYYFPAFNLADSCISVGGALLALIFLLKKDINEKSI